MSTINYSASKRGRKKDRLRATVAGLTLAGLVLSAGSATMMMTTTPAYAANLTHGNGFSNPSYDYILGSWQTVDGKLAYCIQFGVPAPNTDQTNLGDQNFVTDNQGNRISGIKVAQLNYVLEKWGQDTSDLTSAAVAWAVWHLTDQVDENGIGFNPVTGADSSIFTFAGNNGQLYRAELTALFNMMVAEARANATLTPGNPSSLSMTGNMVDGQFKGVVNTPAGYSELDLTNATFDTNGSPTYSPNKVAGAYEWTGMVPDSATTSYTVDVTGTWEVPQNDYVEYWESVNGQDVIGKPVNPPKRTGQSLGSVSQDIGLSPELTSQVEQKRVEGDGTGKVTLTDTINLSLNTAAAAPYNSPDLRKYENGDYAQFNVGYKVYGPLAADPAVTTVAPTDAPLAASGSIETSATDGFDVPYSASVEIDDKSGYYTWVWDITAADQSAKTQAIIPANYSFTDSYGLEEETSVVPTKLRFVTQLSSNRGPSGTVVTDDLTTSVDGFWLEDESGVRHSTELIGTIYKETADELVQQPTAPATAEALDTITMTVDTPGQTYTSEEFSFGNEKGMYTIQWCVPASETFEAWCDDYGVPAESFEVVAPTVTTLAQTTAVFGESVTDTALIEGNVPDNTKLRFTAYREVVVGDPKFDAEGNVIADQFWTAADIEGLSEGDLCEIQPIGVTSLVDVNNNEKSYTSPAIKTTAAGSNHRMYWVEELLVVNPDTKEEILLDKGRCGEKTEITYVTWPTITTDAGGDIKVGESRGDRTFVKNANPDLAYLVTHDLYLAKAGDKAPTCDAERRVFTTKDKPVKIEGKSEYEFTSAPYKYEKAGQYYWVEKLWHDDKLISQGKCGEPSESLTASTLPPIDAEIPGDPKLTTTSTPVSAGLLIAGAMMLLAGGVTAVVARRVA